MVVSIEGDRGTLLEESKLIEGGVEGKNEVMCNSVFLDITLCYIQTLFARVPLPSWMDS